MRKLAIIISFPAFLAAMRFLPLERLPSTCVFFHLTGYPCPTCGMTRAMIALTHLDLGRAVQLNLLALVFLSVFLAWWSVAVYQIAVGQQTRIAGWAATRTIPLVLAGLGILFLFGALRIAALAFQ